MKKTNETAQAGLEYLITYGWALVLVVSVASVLFFVFGPAASSVVFSSSDPTKIILRAGNIFGSNAEIQLQNATGGKINITSITPTGYSNCTANGTSPPVSVGAGSIMKLNCSAPSDGKGSIKIDYVNYAGLQRSVTINASGTSGSVVGSQLFEYYNAVTGSSASIYGTLWRAQTFTPSVDHELTSVKLKLYRSGSPGTITVGIRATDGSGYPTGSDLCSGTTNGDTLPTSYPFEWREIIMDNPCSLSAGTKYAIATRASGSIVWWFYLSVGGYANGSFYSSSNSGASWSSSAPIDALFEEWGTPS